MTVVGGGVASTYMGRSDVKFTSAFSNDFPCFPFFLSVFSSICWTASLVLSLSNYFQSIGFYLNFFLFTYLRLALVAASMTMASVVVVPACVGMFAYALGVCLVIRA